MISAKVRAFLPSTSPMLMRRLAANLGVAVGQQVERLGLGQLLAAERKAQIGDGFVEQPRPGGAAGDVFLVQQLFDLVGELVRAKGAGIAQPRAIMGERRVGLFGRELRVVEAVEFEGEEQQRRRDRVDPLLHRLVEAADLRVGEIAGMHQRGIADDPAALFLQPLEGCDRRAQRRPRQRGKLALVARSEGLGVGGERRQIAGQFGAVATGIEIAEIPFRQRPERCFFIGRRRCRFCRRLDPHRTLPSRPRAEDMGLRRQEPSQVNAVYARPRR